MLRTFHALLNYPTKKREGKPSRFESYFSKNYLTISLNFLPAVKAGTVFAGILISAPV